VSTFQNSGRGRADAIASVEKRRRLNAGAFMTVPTATLILATAASFDFKHAARPYVSLHQSHRSRLIRIIFPRLASLLLSLALGGCGGGSGTTADLPADPSPGTAKSAISHVIVVIMQNHSFDNLFGTYPMANGLDPTAPSYNQINANGTTVSPTLLNNLTTADLNHDGTSYTAAYDGGKMDKYALTNGDLSMQYFDNTISGTTNDGKTYSIATLWNYAQQYTLADNFFASAMNSEPANMLYMVAATVHDDLTASGAPYYDHCSAEDVAESSGTIAQPLTETNVGDQLNANKVSWVWYQGNYNTSVNSACVDYVPQENPFQYFTTTQYSANLRSLCTAHRFGVR
jgi:phospholipase C